jgi:NAD(P)-dependent dehydrogenase (short-subunit alcohol dehydrogenase family)
MDLGLSGRTAVVCASSQGLGRACATELARAYFDDPDGNGLEISCDIRRDANGAALWLGENRPVGEDRLRATQGVPADEPAP